MNGEQKYWLIFWAMVIAGITIYKVTELLVN